MKRSTGEHSHMSETNAILTGEVSAAWGQGQCPS